MARENVRYGLIGIGEPHGFGEEDRFEGDIEPAIAREQGIHAQGTIPLLVFGAFWHKDSGCSMTPARTPLSCSSAWAGHLPGRPPRRTIPI